MSRIHMTIRATGIVSLLTLGRLYVPTCGMALILLFSLTGCDRQAPPETKVAPRCFRPNGQGYARGQVFLRFGHQTLLVQGTVHSVTKQDGNFEVLLETSVPMKILCQFGSQEPKVKVGETIVVQSAEGERAGSYISLRHCRLH